MTVYTRKITKEQYDRAVNNKGMLTEEDEETIGPNGEDEDEDENNEEDIKEGPVADAGQSEDNEGTQVQSEDRTGGSSREDDENSTPVNTDIANDSHESSSNTQINR